MSSFDPNATGDTGGGGAGEAEPALHESWTKAFDEAGVPDLMRGKLSEQIRRSEAAANKRIEELNARQMPDDWAELYQQAQAAGVTPAQFVEDYNGARGIQADPVGFMVAMRDQIDSMVARGEMTPYEGYQAKQQAQAAATGQQVPGEGDAGWESPQDAEIRQLREQLEQLSQGQQQILTQREQEIQAQQDAWEQQQAEQYATGAAEQLIALAESRGFSREDSQSLQVIGAIASSYIEQGLEVGQAFQQAVDLAAARVQPAAGQVRQQQFIPPIGGGTPGAVAGTTEGTHFANERDRAAAMIAAGKALAAQG